MTGGSARKDRMAFIERVTLVKAAWEADLAKTSTSSSSKEWKDSVKKSLDEHKKKDTRAKMAAAALKAQTAFESRAAKRVCTVVAKAAATAAAAGGEDAGLPDGTP